MATRKVTKKPSAVTKRKAQVKSTKPAVKTANATVAHKVVLASLGAAKRAQTEAKSVYGEVYNRIARETERFSGLTTDAAQALAKKATVFVKEGQKIQSNVQAVAEAKAREVAKEVKAFAAKSEKSFKKNLQGSVNTTTANAKEGITRLEQVFEARVAKTLNTFGIPSAQNVRELQSRMTDLQKSLAQLNKRGVRA